MTHEGIRRTLIAIREASVDWEPSTEGLNLYAQLDQLIAALEAEKPLAEVEGWIAVNELGMTKEELASGYTYLRIEKDRGSKTDIPVTVTITKRGQW